LSAAGHADCGFVLAAIAQHHAQGPDAAVQLQRARSEYEQAIALNGDDIASLYEFGAMIDAQKDVEAAKKLKPVMEQAFNRYAYDAELARGLVRICLVSGDLNDALKFAVTWQENAKSVTDEDQATAYVSRLKADVERQATAGLDRQN
jgi:hypothetical protein